MLGRGKDEDNPVDEKEAEKIKDRLDEGEAIVMSVRQSRVKPGGAAVVNPKHHIPDRQARHNQEPDEDGARRAH